MKPNELNSMDIKDLNRELLASCKEQFNLRMRKATHQLNQTHLLKQVRRKIAVIKTLLRIKAS